MIFWREFWHTLNITKKIKTMELIAKIIIKGTIKAETGLMIGATNSSMSIGGPNKMVIRNALTNEPYIPGSTLKGKMRSLFEISKGMIGPKNGGDVSHGPYIALDFVGTELFGTAGDSKDIIGQASRILVRDAPLNKKSKEQLEKTRLDLPFTEIKTENVIDRITSAANPRNFERVPAGTKFDFEIVINEFKGEKIIEYLKVVKTCFELLEDDYIGGGGSRGNGQIGFTISSLVRKEISDYLNGTNGNELSEEISNLFSKWQTA